ncbi:uncharacterized protein VP01_1812g5 [Puccinia sorghi]|uniref:Uncharacterized protein n=1 Tax=Puccinia sorghi TaxID=27349 RepID=A0A0L6VE78_9BASI|nr:uncharacterized protein VP01_1812g5 [Puccinia sorghi]
MQDLNHRPKPISNQVPPAATSLIRWGHTEELLGTIQHLGQMPEQDRLPAASMMMFTGLQEVDAGMSSSVTQASARINLTLQPSLSPQPTQPPPTNRGRPEVIETTQSFKTFLQCNIRQILLRPDLQAFDRKPGSKARVVKTLFTLIKEMIDAQDEQFHTAHFPPNWRDDWQAAEKNLLGRIIKAGLTENEIVPPLPELVADDALITNAAKARLAYLRIMIHLNQLERVKNCNKETATCCNQIDDDLATQRKKEPIFRLAFGSLIIKKDRELWNGQNTASNVSAQAAALPTEAEIALLMAKGNDDEGNEAGSA